MAGPIEMNRWNIDERAAKRTDIFHATIGARRSAPLRKP
jgi:hypothetical protein